jgi:hypothetical protein
LRRNPERPAGVVGANTAAVVRWGTVGESLLTSDATAAYGVRVDPAALDSAYETASRAASKAAAGRAAASLVVLDAGDTFRASRATRATSDPEPTWATVAEQNLEQVVALGVNGLTPNDLLMVVSVPTYGSVSKPQGFGTVLLWGREFSAKPALATSPSTRRAGLVTLPDLSATAVSAAGIAPPAEFVGSPVDPVWDVGTLAERFDRLEAAALTARAVLEVKYLVLTYVSVVALVSVGVGVLVSWWLHRKHRPLSGISAWLLEALLLFAASVPVASWLAFAIEPLPKTGDAVVANVVRASVGVWLIALVVRAILPPRIALAVVTLGSAAVYAIDQWTGASLSYTAPLGYSPLEAARFYGLGNEAAAFMLSGALVGLAALCDHLGGASGRRLAAWSVPLVGGVLVATAVLPAAGANIGVAVWGTFLVVLAARLMAGGRLTWRLVLVAVLLAAAVTAAAAWISSASSAETHVARAISSAEASGIGALATIVARKASANLGYLVRTPWILIFFAIYGGLLWGAFKQRGTFDELAERDPAYVAALKAVLLACVIAFFSEDSGIIMAVGLVNLTLVGFAYLSVVAVRKDSIRPHTAAAPLAEEAPS